MLKKTRMSAFFKKPFSSFNASHFNRLRHGHKVLGSILEICFRFRVYVDVFNRLFVFSPLNLILVFFNGNFCRRKQQLKYGAYACASHDRCSFDRGLDVSSFWGIGK